MTKHKFVCGKCGYTAIDMYGDYLHHPPETCISILMTKCENLKEINADLLDALEKACNLIESHHMYLDMVVGDTVPNEHKELLSTFKVTVAKAKVIR